MTIHRRIHFRSWFHLVSLAILTLSWPGAIHAQFALSRQYVLPDPHQRTQVECMLQSHSGLMWLGTPAGLFSFDGQEYVQWARPDSLAKEVAVSALFEDQDEMLWVGYSDGGIARWKSPHEGLSLWSPEEGTPKSRISGFAYSSGNFWIATYGEGVYIYRGHRLYNFGLEDGLPDLEVYCITADSHHRIWIGTDAGLAELRFLGDFNKFVRAVDTDLFPDQIVQTIHPDAKGNLWLGFFEGQVGLFSPDSGHFDLLPPSPVPSPVTCLLELEDIELWIGTENQDLWRFDLHDHCWRKGTSSPALPGAIIHDILLDRENNIWVASQPHGMFSFYRPIEFIQTNGISAQALVEDHIGQLWVGTPEGLYRLSAAVNNGLTWPKNPQSLKGQHILSLARTTDGHIWAGTFGNGLFHLDGSGNTLQHLTEKDGLSNGNILSITSDASNIWLTTLGGVSRLTWPDPEGDTPKINHYGKQEGLTSQFIYCSHLDQKGNLWFGSDGEGLSCLLANGQTVHYRTINDQELQSVYSITSDNKGHIWFSTANKGIYEYDGHQFYSLAIKEGLRDLLITGLFTDQNGRVIILHQSGIDVLDPESRHLIYYDETVGLENIDPNLNAVGIGHSGVYWIGATDRIIRYTALQNPGVIHPNTILNMAQLLNGRRIHGGESLASNENYLHFAYTGLWYTDPKKVLYRYRLDGEDLDWKQTRDHELTFSGLAPGEYTLRVQATENGDWLDEPELNFSFTIRSPWWQQIWFILLALLGALLLARSILRYRDKRIQRDALIQREKIELQLETLKSQINPHFLFNSFNTLLAVIESDPGSAARYVEELSDFYRQILAYREKDVIPLQEELQLIGNYKHLLERRFGTHVHLEIDMPDTSGYIVPLTLQLPMSFS
ncbi:MAG: histidine kinase [Saprospiraceae bacterium]|nr:histidine kinase [Saprospiraceae bacterium]